MVIWKQPLVLHNFMHLDACRPVFIKHAPDQGNGAIWNFDTALGKLDRLRDYVILNSFQIICF